MRRLAACVLLLALVPAVPSAVAAPKATRCKHLVEDARGDASAAGMDILYADILGRTEVTAVLRLAAVPGMDAPLDRLGARWTLAASAGGLRYAFTLSRDVATSRQDSSVAIAGVDVPHSLKIDGGTVVWKAKRAVSVKPKTWWTDATVTTDAVVDGDTATMCGRQKAK